MKLTSLYTGGLLAVTCCLAPFNSFGGLAYNFPSTLPTSGNYTASALGTVFTVNEPVFINQLGVFDDGRNGFSAQINVAIYSVTFNGGDNSISGAGGQQFAIQRFSQTQSIPNGTLVAGTSTRVKDVGPVSLQPGSYIVVAALQSGTGTEALYDRTGTADTDPQPSLGNLGTSITFEGNYKADFLSSSLPSGSLPGTWTYDTGAAGWAPAYAAGNFDFTPVPEPVHFAMAGVGMLGLVYIGRGLWMRRKTA